MKKVKKLLSVVLVLLLACSFISAVPIMAEEENLLTNASFESEESKPWNFSFKNSNASEVLYEEARKFGNAADGDYYLDLKDLTGVLIYTISDLEPYKRYGFTFSMKSSIADVITPYITFYGVDNSGKLVEYTKGVFEGIDPESPSVLGQAYAINNDATYKVGTALTDENEKNTWNTYGFEIPVQSKRVSRAIVKLRVSTADSYLCLDNFSLKEHKGQYNYMANGSLEYMKGKNLTSAWSEKLEIDPKTSISYDGLRTDVDETGNKIKYLAGGTNALKVFQSVFLTSGRYKLSFKAKMDAPLARVFIHFTCSDTSVTWSNYGVHVVTGSFATIGNIPGTDWTDVEYYFSIPTDSEGKEKAYALTFMLPSTRPGVANIIGGYYDDFELVRDENHIEFGENIWRTKINYGGNSLYKANQFSSISEAKGAGRTSVPVSAVVYPATPDGISETAYLITCIYNTEGGIKTLKKMSFVSGSTVENNEADTTSGANIYGIIPLTANVEIPEDVNANYSIEAYLWRTLTGSNSISDKAILNY